MLVGGFCFSDTISSFLIQISIPKLCLSADYEYCSNTTVLEKNHILLLFICRDIDCLCSKKSVNLLICVFNK